MSIHHFASSYAKNVFLCLTLFVINIFSSTISFAQIPEFNSKTLKVCSDAGFLPFEMRTSTGGWEGFDVDMMREFAKFLDLKLEMVQISFDGIIPALQSGKCDIIAAGMTVTPEREKVVNFSKSTFQNGLSIAVKVNVKSAQYTNLESLDKKGTKIAVKTGYTSDIYLSKNLKNAQVLRFDQDADLLLAVMEGRADAFVSDSTYVAVISKQHPAKLRILSTNIKTENFSVATRKQDKKLNDSFNLFLAKWKNSKSYLEIYKKYF